MTEFYSSLHKVGLLYRRAVGRSPKKQILKIGSLAFQPVLNKQEDPSIRFRLGYVGLSLFRFGFVRLDLFYVRLGYVGIG